MRWREWIDNIDRDSLSREKIDDYEGITPVTSDWLLSISRKGQALYPFFTLARDSIPADVASYTVPALLSGVHLATEKGIRTGLQSGLTLKLQFLETFAPDLLDAVAPVSRLLKGSASVYAFLTPPGRRGLKMHRDASSVVVLQFEGKKLWHVWEPPYGSDVPSRADLEPNPPGTELSFVLNPGDAMFLPFGWPHAAEAVGEEASLHLTWTIDQLSPAELRTYLERMPQNSNSTPEAVVQAARLAYRYGDL